MAASGLHRRIISMPNIPLLTSVIRSSSARSASTSTSSARSESPWPSDQGHSTGPAPGGKVAARVQKEKNKRPTHQSFDPESRIHLTRGGAEYTVQLILLDPWDRNDDSGSRAWDNTMASRAEGTSDIAFGIEILRQVCSKSCLSFGQMLTKLISFAMSAECFETTAQRM
jgi:hypothetical protein